MKTFLERDNAVEALKIMQEIESKVFDLYVDGFIKEKDYDAINLTESIDNLYQKIKAFEKEQIKKTK